MGIMKRWTPATPEYVETLLYISERRYHQALNNLQRLVTQRLFELHRLNLSGVGKFFPTRYLLTLILGQVIRLVPILRSPCKHGARQFAVLRRPITVLHKLSTLLARHSTGRKSHDIAS